MYKSPAHIGLAGARGGEVLRTGSVESSIVAILRHRALQQPEALAYKFLQYTHAGCSERDWSYAELDQQARMVGAALCTLGTFQQPVLLLFPSGLEYIAAFFGCFYAGAIAVTAYPPRRARSMDRIGAILEDAHSSVILTTSALQTPIQEWLREHPTDSAVTVLAIDALDETLAHAWQEPALTPDCLAFLQYTSGSTAAPKGVMVSHGNLLHNSALIQHYSRTDERDVCVSWLPIYHDMGLIGGIIQPAYAGYPTVFMDPVQFLQFPLRWLSAISQHRGTITYAPNFAFEQCIRRARPQDLAGLDLSCWRGAANGAEPIRVETLEHFYQTFAPCGLRPGTLRSCYGLAEGTLVVSSEIVGEGESIQSFDRQALAENRVRPVAAESPQAQKLAGCGSPTLGQRVMIVHPAECTACLPDEIGEIWMQGASVARGYWQNPQASAQTFEATLAESGEGPFLRTGDLGFFYDGQLYITGRLKDVIILNGRNHYPQDIELSTEKSHPALCAGSCVAFSIEQVRAERLVVLAEVNPRYRPPQGQPHPSISEIQACIRRAIADAHDIHAHDVVLLQLGEVLRTSSGKLQRRACRERYLQEKLNRWSEQEASERNKR